MVKLGILNQISTGAGRGCSICTNAQTTTALYLLDPKTGELKEVAVYSGISPTSMGIVFNKDGTLYATNYADLSYLYEAGPATGKGKKIAELPVRRVHSADMKPTP